MKTATFINQTGAFSVIAQTKTGFSLSCKGDNNCGEMELVNEFFFASVLLVDNR